MAGVGCALLLCLGTGYTTTINSIVPSIMEGVNASMTVFMLGPSCGTLGAFLGSLIATKAIDKLTPKYSLLIGTICVTLFLAVVAMTSSVVVWIVGNILGGVVMSFGAHAAASGIISKFYGTKTETAYGVVAGAYSIINALEVFVVAALLNVTDYRTVLFIIAVASLILGLFANFVLIGRVPSTPIAGYEIVKENPKEKDANGGLGFTLKQVLRKPSFYLFFIFMILGAWCLSAIGTFTTIFFTDNGVSSSWSAVLYGIHNTVGALLMLFAGVITNKFSARVTSTATFGCFIAGIIMLVVWGSTGIAPLAYLGMAFTSTILMVAIMPSIFIPDLFGMKDYTSINAAGMAGYFAGHTIVMVGLAGIAEAIGINGAFLVTAGFGAVALVLMFVAYGMRPMKQLNDTQQGQISEVSVQ